MPSYVEYVLRGGWQRKSWTDNAMDWTTSSLNADVKINSRLYRDSVEGWLTALDNNSNLILEVNTLRARKIVFI